MQHVPQHAPGTWRSRAQRPSRPDFKQRAVALYLQLTDGPGALLAVRRRCVQVYNRLKKARSATQSASAYERLLEEVYTLLLTGKLPREKLHLVAVHLCTLLNELEGGTVTDASVLQAIETAKRVGASELLADIRLLARPARDLQPADLDAAIEATNADTAANHEKVRVFMLKRAQLVGARRGIRLVTGALLTLTLSGCDALARLTGPKRGPCPMVLVDSVPVIRFDGDTVWGEAWVEDCTGRVRE